MKIIRGLNYFFVVALGFFAVMFAIDRFGNRSAQAPADTVLYTEEYCKDIIGYDGPTPVKITIVDGVVASVEALPNTETPRFFERVLQSGLLNAVVGKKVSEAAEMPLDAVTGATYSSQALIDNLRAGLKEAAKR